MQLFLSESRLRGSAFRPKQFFEQELTNAKLGPTLFVFDNFETTQNPVEMYQWIDMFIRLPNKALITTRLRDFKGDYPLEVHGMTDHEAMQLISQVSAHLNIHHLITKDYADKMISLSEGHPYVIKILLGEVAIQGHRRSLQHVIAGRDEILTALFERTYAQAPNRVRSVHYDTRILRWRGAKNCG